MIKTRNIFKKSVLMMAIFVLLLGNLVGAISSPVTVSAADNNQKKSSINANFGATYKAKSYKNGTATEKGSKIYGTYDVRPYKDIIVNQNVGQWRNYDFEGTGFVAPEVTGTYHFTGVLNGMQREDKIALTVSDANTNEVIGTNEFISTSNLHHNKESTVNLSLQLKKGKTYKVSDYTYIDNRYTNKHHMYNRVDVQVPTHSSEEVLGTGTVGNQTISTSLLDNEAKTGTMYVFNDATSANNYADHIKNVDYLSDAKEKVEALFTDENFNAIKDSTNQEKINQAQEAVNKVINGPEKDRLQGLINKAQELLDARIKEENELNEAKRLVEGLFTNQNFNAIKDSTNQNSIDIAQAAVDKLPNNYEKGRLQGLINTAQLLLDQRDKETELVNNAKDLVEGLFTNKNFNAIKDSTNQKKINEAQAAVSQLKPSAEKNRLQGLVDKAQELLDAREEAIANLADAKAKVEDLFTNNKFNELKDSTNQNSIDEAQKAFNKLPASAEKDRLQGLIDTAQDLLNAKKAVDNLTDDHGVVKPNVTDKDIESVQDLINKLPNGSTKEELQNELNDIKDQLSTTGIKVESVSAVYATDTQVTGTVSAQVERVYIYLNNQLVRYRPVSANNSFVGHVSNNLKQGDKITIRPADKDGRFGEEISITVKADNAVGKPKMNAYQEGDLYINGTVAKDTAYVRIYVNGEHIRKRNVEADKVSINAYLLDADAKVGDIIKVVPYNAVDEAGYAEVVYVRSGPVQIDPYLVNDEQIRGTATVKADKIDIYVNDKFLRTRDFDKQTGKFFGSMRENIIGLPKSGDVIKIVARTNSGHILSEGEITVGKPVDVNAPILNDFAEGDLRISGTIEKANSMRVYYGDNFSKTVKRGQVVNNEFVIYVGDLQLKKGDKVKVVGIQANERETDSTIITVQ